MLEEGLFKEALNDDYYLDLIREYRILSAKYSLQPVHGWIWKFSRLRPANFPTIRISQLAAMLSATGGLFSKAIGSQRYKDSLELFLRCTASEYWDDHFVFGKKTAKLFKDYRIAGCRIFFYQCSYTCDFLFMAEAGIVRKYATGQSLSLKRSS